MLARRVDSTVPLAYRDRLDASGCRPESGLFSDWIAALIFQPFGNHHGPNVNLMANYVRDQTGRRLDRHVTQSSKTKSKSSDFSLTISAKLWLGWSCYWSALNCRHSQTSRAPWYLMSLSQREMGGSKCELRSKYSVFSSENLRIVSGLWEVIISCPDCSNDRRSAIVRYSGATEVTWLKSTCQLRFFQATVPIVCLADWYRDSQNSGGYGHSFVESS